MPDAINLPENLRMICAGFPTTGEAEGKAGSSKGRRAPLR